MSEFDNGKVIDVNCLTKMDYVKIIVATLVVANGTLNLIHQIAYKQLGWESVGMFIAIIICTYYILRKMNLV